MALRSLYLCYLPLGEPLVETQVLAYLEGLASAGHEIHLLTWEVERRTPADRAAARRALEARGVHWYPLRYHKRLSLLATAYDTLAGITTGTWLVRRRRIQLVHARNHVPMAMALGMRLFARRALLFDVRGLMAEEYVDGGMWREGNLAWRITKRVERAGLRRADGVVVLTERAKHHLFGDRDRTASGAPIAVIPTCADTDEIERAAPRRDEVRRRLGFEDARVLAYAGKFSTWYMAREMAALFAAAHERDSRWRFLVLTQSPPALIVEHLGALGVPPDAYVVTEVAPHEVGAHLAAADAGISFIAAAPSKIASSPTKIGEYLAAGLPVLASAGVGDTDAMLTRDRVGVVVTGHTRAGHDDALDALDALLDDPAIGDRCRATAREHASLRVVGVPRYRDLYTAIAERMSSRP